MMVHNSLHVCYEGGGIDLGSSRLAVWLSRDWALPDPVSRERIAERLLAEAAQDGVLANIWGHAGIIAITNDSPGVLDDFLQDWP